MIFEIIRQSTSKKNIIIVVLFRGLVSMDWRRNLTNMPK
jgi:hypothetical protein